MIRNGLSAILGLALGWSVVKVFSRVDEPREEVEVWGGSLLGRREAQRRDIPEWLGDQFDGTSPEYLRLRALATNGAGENLEPFPYLLKRILQEQKDTYRTNPVLRCLLAQWIEEDPLGAFEHCQGMVEPRHRKAALREWARQWAAIDPDASLSELETLLPVDTKNSDLKYALVAGITETIGASDPRAALAVMAAYQLYPHDSIQVIAQAAPAAMADVILNDVELGSRGSAINGLMRVWTERDATGAVDYFKSLEEKDRAKMVEPLCRQLALHDPEKAYAVYRDHRVLGDSGSHFRILREIATSWAERQPVAAAQWALSIEGEESETSRRSLK